MVLTIIVFLTILSILVLVHELGHFIVGRLNGIKIEEFALGLPFTKPLFSKRLPDGMKLSLYPLLFGGFVKLLGEETEEKSLGSFKHKSVWQRISVVVAGVTMNLVLAIIAFYVFLALSNFRVLIPKLVEYDFLSPSETRVVIVEIQKDTPAEAARLRIGDVVMAADNQEIKKLAAFQNYVKSRAGQPVVLTVADTDLANLREVAVTPRISPPPGQGALGVAIDEAAELEYIKPEQKAVSGLSYGADMLFYNIRIIGHFITRAFQTGETAPLSETVSGPVGIASAVDMILGLGGGKAFIQLINLLGLLSLSLAFMNILPFPALDGGRLAFLLVEAVTGKKVPSKYENLINQIGMAILLGLIILISFSDLRKLFSP